MGYNLSGLSAYVDQTKNDLIKKSLFGFKSKNYLTVQTGIKSANSLNILDQSISFNSQTCGWVPTGSATISQRNITVGNIVIQNDYCEDQLAAYFTQYWMKPGAQNGELTFEKFLVDALIEGTAKAMETAVWQGNTASANVNLNKFDGLLKNIDTCSGSATVISTGASGTASGSGLISYIQSVYNNIPADILDDEVNVFVGRDVFRAYQMALTSTGNGIGMFNYVTDNTWELPIPGATNVKVIGVNGLNTTYRIVGSAKNNLYFGTDLESDYESASALNPDWDLSGTARIRVKFRAGTQVAFCDQIVLGKVTV